VLALHRAGLLHAAAHVTGGGLLENLPRALPDGLGADLERGSWVEPPIFGLLRAATEASEADLLGTFNLGIGMVLVVAAGEAGAAIDLAGPGACRIGRVGSSPGVHLA
jgi:phosphoribosylformylglycinamidine cyclo-ligase